MKTTVFAAGMLLALGAAAQVRQVGEVVLDGIPEIPAEVRDRLEQYQNVRSASFLGWQPKGKGLLILTRFGETNQAHLVEAPGAARRQLTFGDELVRMAAFDPADPNRLLIQQDRGGSEFYQLFVMDLASGRTTLLTDGKSRNEYPVFAPKGRRVAYASTRRNNKDFDIWVQDVTKPDSAKLLTERSGLWSVLDWSREGKTILLQNYVSINDASLHVVDVESGQVREIPRRNKAAWLGGRFLDDGTVLTSTDDGTEFRHLVKLDVASGKWTVLSKDVPWDVEAIAVSKDGKQVAWSANENGTSSLYLTPTNALTKHRKIALPKGVLGRLEFDDSGKRLGFSLNAGDAPEDAWSVDTKNLKLTRWTFSEVGGLNPETFVAPELIQYPTFDDRKIPAWIYRPKKAKGKIPVVISIHGGPEAQSKAWFSPVAQSWTNELGVAVIYPNVRGSAGFGKSWLLLDNAEKREDSVKDIGALLDWVAKQPDLDASRVAVYGGSYGGFMVLASMVAYGDKLRAGVDIVGISHFVTFLEKTESYRRDLRRAEYGDERDPKMKAILDRISPLTNAAKINKPLFVAQGANDPRVPQPEAEQIVKTVRKNGTPVWYLLAKDEGHGFQKKRNRDLFNEVTFLFFQRFLLGDGK